MDYFNNVLTTFLGLEHVVALLSMEGQKALRFHQKYHQKEKIIIKNFKNDVKYCHTQVTMLVHNTVLVSLKINARSPAKTYSSSMPVKNVACYCDI